MESPVWTPIGSKFSMLQTVMQVSLRVAHHLVLDLFPAVEVALDHDLMPHARASRPRRPISLQLLVVIAMPPPVPPSV